ncbi:hypothetical protein CCACVL1_19084 [Corchorus capsularis]|uniref:Uncharacterized protein n=1 Tax=Corchorus capsularis TaxID=210143 RepID=A0A1R3HIH2_COCAP|nr:hypothetical protein CCACVL1_19084 [Corchorus capsularis]
MALPPQQEATVAQLKPERVIQRQ